MSQRRLNDGSEIGSVSIAAYEHPVIYEYLGKNRYLQTSFCKSVARLYSDKFGMYTTKALSNIAAEGGFIGLLGWCKEIGCRWNENVFVSGARGGNVVMLKFLEDKECPMPSADEAWRVATERGHLEVLKFAYDSRYIQDIHYLCQIAAKKGRVNILEWVHELEGSRYFNANTFTHAAEGGFIEVVQYLRSIGCEWDKRTCWRAISNGHVDVLKWALDNGCPWDVEDISLLGMSELLNAENIEMIEFLISRGADINTTNIVGMTAIYLATENGRLEAVVTLVRLGADVNIADGDGLTPLDMAITKGNPEIVEVLRSAGARESH